MWIVQPLQLAKDGKPTGRWRLTATSDEDGGGPWGDTTHDHASADEATNCDKCDEFCSGVTGFMSRKKVAELRLARERAEFERLKAKFEQQKI